MSRPPDFDDLVGAEVGPEERERLRTAHHLLVEAGPPAELEPWLEQPPAPWVPAPGARRERHGERRRWSVPVLVAASIAGLAFLLGTLLQNGGGGFHATVRVPMHGTAAVPKASAVIEIADKDAAGNWPMLLKVSGLKPLARGEDYQLFLTKKGRRVVSCGTFRVGEGETTKVRLNAPYLFKGAGWIVVRAARGKQVRTLLTT